MNDRAVGLLEQYDIEVQRTRKGRGAILCETDKGLLIFKEYAGNPRHLKLQELLLKKVEEKGLVSAEQLLANKEGELFVRDNDGVRYLLKTYRDGRECNIRDRGECMEAMKLLAGLHLSIEDGIGADAGQEEVPAASEDPETESETEFREPQPFCIGAEYEKRCRELKKIRKFLQNRGQKTWFELSLLGCFDRFYNQALEAQQGWAVYSTLAQESSGQTYCHGDYQYHNLLLGDGGWYLINFERCVRDDPVRDIHLILRKLLEKSGWSMDLGADLLAAYERVRPLSAVSRIDLFYRLSFPDKFWKIANFYYNSGKAWIPGRNQEKLEKLLAQEADKKAFLETVFGV